MFNTSVPTATEHSPPPLHGRMQKHWPFRVRITRYIQIYVLYASAQFITVTAYGISYIVPRAIKMLNVCEISLNYKGLYLCKYLPIPDHLFSSESFGRN
jgi:hypothetical protein